jgi:hypothetical protein
MSAFTLFHVVLSLVGLGSGLVVAFGLLLGKRQPIWTATFLSTTVLTSITGFMFPVHHFMPSHEVGIVSLIALDLAICALYVKRLAGGWRPGLCDRCRDCSISEFLRPDRAALPEGTSAKGTGPNPDRGAVLSSRSL